MLDHGSPDLKRKHGFWHADTLWVLPSKASLDTVHIYIYIYSFVVFFPQVFFESFQKGAGNDILGTLLQKNMYVHYQHSKQYLTK